MRPQIMFSVTNRVRYRTVGTSLLEVEPEQPWNRDGAKASNATGVSSDPKGMGGTFPGYLSRCIIVSTRDLRRSSYLSRSLYLGSELIVPLAVIQQENFAPLDYRS